MPTYSFVLEFLHSLILLLHDMTVTILDLSSAYIPWLACVFNFDFPFLWFIVFSPCSSALFSPSNTYTWTSYRTLAYLPFYHSLPPSYLPIWCSVHLTKWKSTWWASPLETESSMKPLRYDTRYDAALYDTIQCHMMWYYPMKRIAGLQIVFHPTSCHIPYHNNYNHKV